ncbi:MAG: MFS transporter, partial [Acinetobacter baumannii]|nr:MFS transporter [Acinetobacter baumannii]
QVSVMATVSGSLYSFSGVIADALGYFHYLIAIVSIAVLFLIPIYLWKAAKTV